MFERSSVLEWNDKYLIKKPELKLNFWIGKFGMDGMHADVHVDWCLKWLFGFDFWWVVDGVVVVPTDKIWDEKGPKAGCPISD